MRPFPASQTNRGAKAASKEKKCEEDPIRRPSGSPSWPWPAPQQQSMDDSAAPVPGGVINLVSPVIKMV